MTAINRFQNTALRQALETLAGAGVIPDIAKILRASLQATGQALRDAVLTEVPAFSMSANPHVLS
jgi:hypothetical protein